MRAWIPYGRQSINEHDIESVMRTLQSDWLTCGPKVNEFENALSDYCGANYTIAFCNATAALHTACLALGVREGDYVWTSPNTFVASANCALYCGANVDFVDIDENTYNISVSALQEKLEFAEKNNKLPKLIISVHFAGQSCDMKAIYALSKQYGFKIIEDASHAIGGRYQDKLIGGCQYSDVTIFSFHPVKVITTGEGGAALTNDAVLAEKLALLRSHGITRNPEQMLDSPDGPWSNQQIALGMNYRITDLQCALGISQLKRLDEFISKRKILAQNYNQLLSELPIKLPYMAPDCDSAYHLYTIQILKEPVSEIRLQLFKFLHENKIGAQVHYFPVHLQPYYRNNFGFKKGDFPKAERYYARTLSLPIFVNLSQEKQIFISNQLRIFFK